MNDPRIRVGMDWGTFRQDAEENIRLLERLGQAARSAFSGANHVIGGGGRMDSPPGTHFDPRTGAVHDDQSGKMLYRPQGGSFLQTTQNVLGGLGGALGALSLGSMLGGNVYGALKGTEQRNELETLGRGAMQAASGLNDIRTASNDVARRFGLLYTETTKYYEGLARSGAIGSPQQQVDLFRQVAATNVNGIMGIDTARTIATEGSKAQSQQIDGRDMQNMQLMVAAAMATNPQMQGRGDELAASINNLAQRFSEQQANAPGSYVSGFSQYAQLLSGMAQVSPGLSGARGEQALGSISGLIKSGDPMSMGMLYSQYMSDHPGQPLSMSMMKQLQYDANDPKNILGLLKQYGSFGDDAGTYMLENKIGNAINPKLVPGLFNMARNENLDAESKQRYLDAVTGNGSAGKLDPSQNDAFARALAIKDPAQQKAAVDAVLAQSDQVKMLAGQQHQQQITSVPDSFVHSGEPNAAATIASIAHTAAVANDISSGPIGAVMRNPVASTALQGGIYAALFGKPLYNLGKGLYRFSQGPGDFFRTLGKGPAETMVKPGAGAIPDYLGGAATEAGAAAPEAAAAGGAEAAAAAGAGGMGLAPLAIGAAGAFALGHELERGVHNTRNGDIGGGVSRFYNAATALTNPLGIAGDITGDVFGDHSAPATILKDVSKYTSPIGLATSAWHGLFGGGGHKKSTPAHTNPGSDLISAPASDQAHAAPSNQATPDILNLQTKSITAQSISLAGDSDLSHAYHSPLNVAMTSNSAQELGKEIAHQLDQLEIARAAKGGQGGGGGFFTPALTNITAASGIVANAARTAGGGAIPAYTGGPTPAGANDTEASLPSAVMAWAKAHAAGLNTTPETLASMLLGLHNVEGGASTFGPENSAGAIGPWQLLGSLRAQTQNPYNVDEALNTLLSTGRLPEGLAAFGSGSPAGLAGAENAVERPGTDATAAALASGRVGAAFNTAQAQLQSVLTPATSATAAAVPSIGPGEYNPDDPAYKHPVNPNISDAPINVPDPGASTMAFMGLDGGRAALRLPSAGNVRSAQAAREAIDVRVSGAVTVTVNTQGTATAVVPLFPDSSGAYADATRTPTSYVQ